MSFETDLLETTASVHSLLTGHMPGNCRVSPKGWHTFSCPMCSDTRRRSGIKIAGSMISFHCFNCPFKASWAPGWQMTKKYIQLAQTMGATDRQVYDAQVSILALGQYGSEIAEVADPRAIEVVSFKKKSFPPGARLVADLSITHPTYQYAKKRGLLEYDLYWLPKNNNRLTFPCYHKYNLVGWISRSIDDDTRPKYLADIPSDYVYNLDEFVYSDREIIVVCEGMVDALRIDGVAITGNQLSAEQAAQIDNLGKRVIVCPDRNKAGLQLIDNAIAMDWEVSFPPWDDFIVDADEACDRYGRLATLASIIRYSVSGKVAIEVKKRLLKNSLR